MRALFTAGIMDTLKQFSTLSLAFTFHVVWEIAKVLMM